MSATLTGAKQVLLACVHFVQASQSARIHQQRLRWVTPCTPGRDRSLGRAAPGREVAARARDVLTNRRTCEQARVTFLADGTRDVAKHSKRGAIDHGSSELSMLATPAHRKDEAQPSFERAPDSRAASGRRTQRKKGPVATPDAATPDSLSAMTPRAGALLDLAIPLTFEEMDLRSTSSTPSAAVATAGAAFRAVLMSARESFDLESAAEKLFESSQLQLLLVEGVAFEPVPVAAALCVMAQASDFMNTMLCKDGRALDQMAAEALQSVGFSLCMLACKVEQEHGHQQGNELESQRKELMESSIKLLGTCLRQWSWASVDEEGDRAAQKRARVSAAALQDRLCSAAAACMQALDRCARDASNARHWMAIMKLALDAVLCDQLPVVQAEGIKLLKSLFASNSEQRASVLDEVSLSLSRSLSRRSRARSLVSLFLLLSILCSLSLSLSRACSLFLPLLLLGLLSLSALCCPCTQGPLNSP